MKYFQLIIAVLTIFLSESVYSENTSLDKLAFDESKYIPVDQLHRGMIGYGLTVFHGSKVEKFKVELVSVVSAKSAGRSSFLIKVIDNEIFDIARGVQGCSGSPVFFDGRMAGAMSYGWNYQKEPLYGVTPIRQMLNAHKRVLANDNKDKVANNIKLLDDQVYHSLMKPQILSQKDLASIAQASGLSTPVNSDNGHNLPVMMSFTGLNSCASEHFSQVLPGFNANVSNFTADVENLLKEGRPKIEPGSAIVIPIIRGDYQAAALGTVTEVVDDWVFAFGHAFNGNGQCNWPMATGYIHTFMSSTAMSFKLGQAVEVVGAVEADEVQAICGRLGQVVDTCKAHTTVQYTPVDETVEFNMELVKDEMYVSSMSMTSVVGPTLYRGELPELCTLEYDVVLDFGDFGKVNISDISSDNSTFDLSLDMVQNTSLVVNSPWGQPLLNNIEAKVKILDKTSLAEIDSVELSNNVFYPGDTVKAKIKCFQYRLPEIVLDAELTLPKDIKPGQYDINIGDKRSYLATLSRTQPQKGFADTSEKIIKVLNERNQYRRDNLYMFMTLNEPGLALEDEALPAIPPGKAMLLTSQSEQKSVGVFNKLIESIKPCDYVILGSTSFKIEVREK